MQPRGAVCCEVLNLLLQVDPDPEMSPWLRAYRVISVRLEPLVRMLVQNLGCNITNTAELTYLYHKPDKHVQEFTRPLEPIRITGIVKA